MKRRDIERILQAWGWSLVRHGGRHDLWGKGQAKLAVPRHAEINEHTAVAILKEARGYRGHQEDRMRLAGRVSRQGKVWAIEVPILGVFTQGTTRADAFVMVADAVAELLDRKKVAIRVHPGTDGSFEISSDNPAALTALLLRRLRSRSGLTLAEMAERLDARSLNAWARYEQGRAVPTIVKLSQLFAAAGNGRDFVIVESSGRD